MDDLRSIAESKHSPEWNAAWAKLEAEYAKDPKAWMAEWRAGNPELAAALDAAGAEFERRMRSYGRHIGAIQARAFYGNMGEAALEQDG